MPSGAKWPDVLFRAFLALWVCSTRWLTEDCPAAGAENREAEIRFSHSRSFFESPFAVKLTTKTPGAKIFYTTNSALPTERDGSRYAAPIRIATTTVLRAAVLGDGQVPADVETQLYSFPGDVVKQTGVGFPAEWGTNLGKPVPADYGMDPEILTNTAYRDELVPALRAMPTLSIVMSNEDLFGTDSGLYVQPRENGVDWERAASVELLLPDGRPGFQVNCGIRIQRGWNRRPEIDRLLKSYFPRRTEVVIKQFRAVGLY